MVRSRRQGGENKVTILQSSWGESMAEFQPHEIHFPNSVHAASRWRKRVTQSEDKGWVVQSQQPPHPLPHVISWASRKLLAGFFFFLIKKAEAKHKKPHTVFISIPFIHNLIYIICPELRNPKKQKVN